ncbi:hypothetical protein J6590_057359 [Homalodisca vitripennis]|nr:hypothetical protein J6590_057359 [Homalodisca vitripennis]
MQRSVAGGIVAPGLNTFTSAKGSRIARRLGVIQVQLSVADGILAPALTRARTRASCEGRVVPRSLSHTEHTQERVRQNPQKHLTTTQQPVPNGELWEWPECAGLCGWSRLRLPPPAESPGPGGVSLSRAPHRHAVLELCLHRVTMYIPDTLRSCMVEPDVSTYLQAPSSGQVHLF